MKATTSELSVNRKTRTLIKINSQAVGNVMICLSSRKNENKQKGMSRFPVYNNVKKRERKGQERKMHAHFCKSFLVIPFHFHLSLFLFLLYVFFLLRLRRVFSHILFKMCYRHIYIENGIYDTVPCVHSTPKKKNVYTGCFTF